jgi:flagellin
MQTTIANLQSLRTNVSAAHGRIRDADVAEESSLLARQQVLLQAGTAVLSQANQAPQLALQLLRG